MPKKFPGDFGNQFGPLFTLKFSNSKKRNSREGSHDFLYKIWVFLEFEVRHKYTDNTEYANINEKLSAHLEPMTVSSKPKFTLDSENLLKKLKFFLLPVHCINFRHQQL